MLNKANKSIDSPRKILYSYIMRTYQIIKISKCGALLLVRYHPMVWFAKRLAAGHFYKWVNDNGHDLW